MEPPDLPPPPPPSADAPLAGTAPRKRSGLSVVVAILVAVSATVAAVFIATRGGGDGLRFRFAVGDVHLYDLSILDETDPFPENPEGGRFTANGTFQTRVTEAIGASATMEVSISELELGFADQTFPQEMNGRQALHVGTDGRQQELVVGATDEAGVLAYLLDPVYPALSGGDVSPGDSWLLEMTVRLAQGEGDTAYEGRGVFLRFEKLEGVRAAVVRNSLTYRYEETIDASALAEVSTGGPSTAEGTLHASGNGSYTITAWIDPASGTLLKAVGTNDYDITSRYEGYPAELTFGTDEIHVTGTSTVTLTLRT